MKRKCTMSNRSSIFNFNMLFSSFSSPFCRFSLAISLTGAPGLPLSANNSLIWKHLPSFHHFHFLSTKIYIENGSMIYSCIFNNKFNDLIFSSLKTVLILKKLIMAKWECCRMKYVCDFSFWRSSSLLLFKTSHKHFLKLLWQLVCN